MMRASGPLLRSIGGVVTFAIPLVALLLVGQGAGAQNPVGFSPDITADLGTVSPSVVAMWPTL